jgi:23S rRNA pseudouridine1911/1915/1917 synthase
MGTMIILFEDNHTLAVVKPHRIPVMPDSSGDASMLDMVKEYIKDKYSKPGKVFIGLVHRLDRPAGGTMVFARTSKGASRLSDQIRTGKFHKTYIAMIEGILDEKKGTLESYLVKDNKKNTSRAVSQETGGAKRALLDYTVIRENSGFSLVKINLHTGRHHQIRVQFSVIGHPIAGDVKYGAKTKDHSIALWSHKISFNKPVGSEIITVESEPDYCSEPWSLMS